MSYYFSYYLGLMGDDGKIRPIGLFDENYEIYPIFSRSRSCASDLHDDFMKVRNDMFTEELKKKFAVQDKGIHYTNLKYLMLDDLPSDSFIKSGYFLISDIEEYEKNGGDSYDLFYDSLTPVVYQKASENELKFGGVKIGDHSIKEYAYYAYPDYYSKDYESFMIQSAFNAYLDSHIEIDRHKCAVLEEEG